MNPSNFLSHPWDSVQQSTEAETVARNIMVILSKAGDTFRRLSWEEYREAWLKDGRFTEMERVYFEQVWPYTLSAEKAAMFSPVWAQAAKEAASSGFLKRHKVEK